MDENSTFIDYRNEGETENGKTDPKELLNNLLKKMLGYKLNKLEKRHAEESNSLKIMSKISQNIIISLDHYSHRVRKEIYKLRHRNDENHSKKRESIKKTYDLNKTMWKDDKINNNEDNNIESLINKHFFNKIGEKRASKSIDPRKDKSFMSEMGINTKEKKSKKEKMDVFARLASKSIGNFKKLKLDINAPANNNNVHLLGSKSKNKKLTSSSKSLYNLSKKNNADKEKDKNNSPSNNLTTRKVENSKKLISTPKLNKKQLKKIVQINLDSTSHTLGTESSKHFAAKTKKTNSKGKLTHRLSKTLAGLKQQEKNEENNKIVTKKEDNEMKKGTNDNKSNTEIKVDKIKDSNNEDKKNSKNDKNFIDEDIIKDVDQDELLISQINIEKIEEINLDNLDIKNSINLDIPLDNNLLKKSSLDLNNNNNNNNSNSINSFNNNNSVNNIKTINNQNNSNTNNNSSNINNSSSRGNHNINNIIISNPKVNTNFLDNNDEINFTLVEDSPMEENDNDFNKTIDLNISGLSDQLSIEEIFESHLDEVSRYLEMKDLCKLMLVNKECFTSIMNVLISKTEITIDILEEELTRVKTTNKNLDFSNIKLTPFKFSSNSARAVSLLNNNSGCNLIKFNKTQGSANKEIFIIFGIYFIAAGRKREYFQLESDDDKINYITNYFKNDLEKMSIGSLIEKEINGKIFDNNIISSLYKYSYKYIHIISPSRFQKANKDIAIFVFVIKNILEHIGIFDLQNIKPDKEYILYHARLQNNKTILDELNKFFDKINS